MRLSDTSNLFPSIAVSPAEGRRYAGRFEEYMVLGRLGLDAVLWAGEFCAKPHYHRILDLGGGGGQVLRWLAAKFEYAELTACDFDHSATEFCETAFGATSVPAPADLRQLHFPAPFDLIWCGTLFGQLPPERWPELFDCLERWTAPCGIAVCGVHGRFFAAELARGRAVVPAGTDRAALLAQFHRTAAAFAPDPAAAGPGRGLSLASLSTIGSLVQTHPNLILSAYLEQAWYCRDLAILYKSPAFFEPVASQPSAALALGAGSAARP
jgi:SAM-dependent methyltransferase